MKTYCPTTERLYFSHPLPLHITTLFGALWLLCLEFSCESQHWKYCLNGDTVLTQLAGAAFEGLKVLPHFVFLSFLLCSMTTACLNQREKTNKTPFVMAGSNWGPYSHWGSWQWQPTGSAHKRKSKVWRAEGWGQAGGQITFLHCAHVLVTKRTEITSVKFTSWGLSELVKLFNLPCPLIFFSITKGKENTF